MAKISKEEIKKRLQLKKTGQNQPNSRKNKNQTNLSPNQILFADLKRLSIITGVVLLILALTIIIKKQTGYFDQIADYLFALLG